MALPLPHQERLARLRLARTDSIGPVTFHELLAHFDSAIDAIEALPELTSQSSRRAPIDVVSEDLAKAEFDATEKLGARLLVFGDPDYPQMLAAADPAPPAISCLGQAGLLIRPTIAIVGSRNASAAGARLAATIAEELGREDYVIASGFARGIDTAAHSASLASGTIGVFAGGLDVVYPPENTSLYDKIKTEGLLISEMPPGTRPIAKLFPRRNRLISGLSLAVVVVEAAMRSGSLITARFALEQGRDVMAVPGSPLDPRAKGSNNLIKQGAPLVECAEDVLAALAPSLPHQLREPEAPRFAKPERQETNEETRRKVLGALSPTPTHIDEIIRHSALPASLVRGVLLELDLAGRLNRETGGHVSLIG